MNNANTIVYAAASVCIFFGLVIPWWPLAVLAVLFTACSGRIVFAVCTGLFFDVLWGTPTGLLHEVPFPLTAGALLGFLVWSVAQLYLRDRVRADRIA